MNPYTQCVLFNILFLTSNGLTNNGVEQVLGNWMEWSLWTSCSEKEYCLEGIRERNRGCENNKRCVGIEAEAEMCPHVLCKGRVKKLDTKHADIHSFIAEECSTTTKYLVTGRYSFLIRHNITRMFPLTKDIIENSYFNVKITPKTLPSEYDIYRYCFEPEERSISLEYLKSVMYSGSLRFKYASLQCPLKEPVNPTYVSGFVLGFYSNGAHYGLYIQVKDKNSFKVVYYKHMRGSYTDVYNLIWD